MLLYPVRKGFRILPLVDKSKIWRCTRSQHNEDRGDRSTINARKDSLKNVGLLPHTRRGPICTTVNPDNNFSDAQCKFALLHWGTLNQALKECAEEEASSLNPNPKIQRALARGYHDVIVLHHDTPAIDQKFIKLYQNFLNDQAQATTFIEVSDISVP